jgi:hypothetical protein
VIRFRQKMNNWKRKVKIEKKLLLEHGDPSFPLSEGHRRSRSATTSLRAPNSFTALPSKKKSFTAHPGTKAPLPPNNSRSEENMRVAAPW